jgi:ribosomal protein S15P/S13E
MKKCTASIIRPKTQARKKVARRLPAKIKASNVGVAFLSAQITDLEERCEAMRNDINNKRPEGTARRAQAA